MGCWPVYFSNAIEHYSGVIMGAMASQITSLTTVYSTVYLGADQRKHESSASLAFVWGIHRPPGNSPHKWPVTRKMFPFDDVIMGSMVVADRLVLIYRHQDPGGGRFKNTYELLTLRALKLSPANEIYIFQCMSMIFCVEFQRYPLKFHTKYHTHTLKDMIFFYTTLKFQEPLYLRAHMRFWNAPQCTDNSNCVLQDCVPYALGRIKVTCNMNDVINTFTQLHINNWYIFEHRVCW